MSYLFPIAFALNLFSMTGFMIALGLFGKPILAAEFGIVQGATMALFYAFSANARNLILNSAFKVTIKDVLFIRLVLIIPLSAISLFLSVGLADISILLAVILIVRRCTEWLSEVYLSQMELDKNVGFAYRFIILQVVTLLFAICMALISDSHFWVGALIWSILPLLILRGMVKHNIFQKTIFSPQIYTRLLPHFGSTAITGVSVYVFRILILLLVGKTVAGDLYTAFAIGSLMGSIFVNALGPSLAYADSTNGTNVLPRWLTMMLASIFLFGLVLFVAAEINMAMLLALNKSFFFWSAIGLSLMGGPIMLIAQRFRIDMLQLHGDRDVMGPDLVSNLVIISFVPFAFYFFGANVLKTLYFFNAMVAMVIYWSAMNSNILKHRIIEDRRNKKRLLCGIAAILVFPLFFQLSGKIFYDVSLIFDTMGKLILVPIPVSVFACMFGLIVIGRYEGTEIALYLIFFTFIVMMTTTVLSTKGLLASQRDKIILLIQFMLPMFAMIVGQMYGYLENNQKIFQKSSIYVLLCIVPIQIISTAVSGNEVLSPNMYIFSIYQQLQYVPTIFVCLYLYSFYSLWEDKKYNIFLFLIAPLMSIYAILSSSITTIFFLYTGLIFSTVLNQTRMVKSKLISLLFIMVCSSIACLIPLKMDNSLLKKHVKSRSIQMSNKVTIANKINDYDHSNLIDRVHIWKWYASQILSSSQTILIGNPTKPFRDQYPSAHNYYLDLVYNFGFLSLIPMMTVIVITFKKILILKATFFKDPLSVGLVLVLIFLFAENLIQVGLRQPYPGIITFFLWGLLLTRLSGMRLLLGTN